MAVALVGFDIDPKERLYGVSDVERSNKRLRRNYALRQGTAKLYLTFLELAQSLQLRRKRAEATLKQIADVWETLLIPLLWRNSQTRTPDYQDLLLSARLYWEANLSGFSWPEQTPTESGIWAPLGSLAYFYFHYGVVNVPNDVFEYAQGALVLYWRFIGEAYGWGSDSYRSLTPTERWQRLKEALGWVDLDYELLERVLLACWEGADRSLQLALRRALLNREDLVDLERSLLLGIASPRLINFLLAHRQELESLAKRLTGNDVSWPFSFSFSQRWKLGPGGVPQVLLSYLVEGLLFGIRLFRLYPDLKYGAFLAEEPYRDQRLGLLQYVTLMHDALAWLQGLYSDLDKLYPQVYYMLSELLALEEKKSVSRHRLFAGELTLDFWLRQVKGKKSQPNLSLLEAYPLVVASLVSPSPYDRVRLVNAPLVLKSGELTELKVQGRPGTAVKLVVLEGGSNTALHSRAVLIGEDGYGYLPVLPWSTASTAQSVVVSVQSLELEEVSTTFEVLVQPVDFLEDSPVQAFVESLPEFRDLVDEPPLSQIVEEYLDTVPDIYRRERELLEQAGPPPADRRNKRGGKGTNILGLLGSIFKLFQALSRTAPLNSNERQHTRLEQLSHYSAAEDTANRVRQASQILKQQQQGVQPKLESVSPTAIKQEVQNFKQIVIPEAGRDLAAAGIAVADNQAAGRSLVQSHEVWQVNTQHARIRTTANFEVSSPHTLISSRLVDIQSRHRLGIHDSVQETAQYLSYRATKLRQVVAENAIDFNNRWYKATSANAHYVAGHYYQYGDELLLQVGRGQSSDETDQAEAAEDNAVSAVEEAEVSGEGRAESLLDAANSAETIVDAQNLHSVAQQHIQSTVQQYLQRINDFLRLFGNFDGSLGSLAAAFNSLFGDSGALTSLFDLVGQTGQVSQAINSVLSLASQVQSIVRQLQSAQDPSNPDPPSQEQIGALISQLGSLLNSDAVTMVSEAIQAVESGASDRQDAVTQAATALGQLVNAINAGQHNDAARRQPASPHLTVLAGEGLNLLTQAANALRPLAQVLGGNVASTIGGIFSTTMQSIAGILPALSGLGGGNFTGIIDSARQIVDMAMRFSNATSGYFSAAANGLLGGGVEGLAGAAQALTDLGLGSHLPLHPQNSQVQKYGHWVADVYKDIGINVRQGGMNIKLKKDFAVNTRLGRFNVRSLRTAVIGRVSADFGSQGRTNLRGRIVIIKADAAIYLDAPKIVCSTRPVTGGAPGISSVTTLLQQVQSYLDKIEEYMAIIRTVAQMLGLGGSGNAPRMSSPAPLQTGQAPGPLAPRPTNADETPTGGALSHVVPDNFIPSNPFSPELAYKISQNLQSESTD